MKTRIQVLVLTLALVVAGGTIASNASSTETKAKNLNEYEIVEIADEMVFLEDIANDIMIFDDSDNLVFEGSSQEPSDSLQNLLRTSDFLLEVEGVRYYKVSNF